MSLVRRSSTRFATCVVAPLIACAPLVLAACDDDAPSVNPGPGDGGGLDGPNSEVASCMLEELAPPSEGANHTSQCAQVQHASNPPASGTHYPNWAAFRAYSKPVPWGFLLHAMEHGAVVIAYNCPEGCADEVAAANAVLESIPRKSECPKPRPPVILTPDPGLSVRFAATAWGHVLRASCFDAPAFTKFITAHANKGPEYFPTDCGSVDLEATGWCP
jgi:hypothetical protein